MVQTSERKRHVHFRHSTPHNAKIYHLYCCAGRHASYMKPSHDRIFYITLFLALRKNGLVACTRNRTADLTSRKHAHQTCALKSCTLQTPTTLTSRSAKDLAVDEKESTSQITVKVKLDLRTYIADTRLCASWLTSNPKEQRSFFGSDASA